MENTGFDLWASSYENDVNVSDGNGDYPFAGYGQVVNDVCDRVMAKAPCRVLDIGIGTGNLSAKLHGNGCEVEGIDFSAKMLEAAAEKMREARLIPHDFAQGLPAELAGQKFDFIVSTYALHHLEDGEKHRLISSAMNFLTDGGAVLIGDVSFENLDAMRESKAHSGDLWDDGEHYLVYADFAAGLSADCVSSFRRHSHCGGVLEIRRRQAAVGKTC